MIRKESSVFPWREPCWESVSCLQVLLVVVEPITFVAACKVYSGLADFHCHRCFSRNVLNMHASSLHLRPALRTDMGSTWKSIHMWYGPSARRRHASSEPVVGRAQNEMELGPRSVFRLFSEGLNPANCALIPISRVACFDTRTSLWQKRCTQQTAQE